MPENTSRPENTSAAPTTAPTATLTVFRLAALFSLLAVAMGSVVCATGSGAACPTWPGCHPDQFAPQWELSPLIEFVHRATAILTGPAVLAAAVMSRRLPGHDRWVRILPWVALAGACAAGIFGRLVVLSGLPTWLGAVDLFSALTSMTVMTVAAVRLGRATPAASSGPAPGPASGPMSPTTAAPAPKGPERLRLPATSAVAVVILMHVTGIFAAGHGSYTRCLGWPLWQLIDGDLHTWLQGVRLGLAGLGAVLIAVTVLVAVRDERLRRVGAALATLFAAEMVAGFVIRGGGLASGIAATYSVLAVAVLWCLGLLAALAWAPDREPVTVPDLTPTPA